MKNHTKLIVLVIITAALLGTISIFVGKLSNDYFKFIGFFLIALVGLKIGGIVGRKLR